MYKYINEQHITEILCDILKNVKTHPSTLGVQSDVAFCAPCFPVLAYIALVA